MPRCGCDELTGSPFGFAWETAVKTGGNGGGRVVHGGFMSCVEFQDLFPDRDLSLVEADDGADHLTVVTLSQRTQNDMTSWNDDVEQERENLLQSVRGHSHYTWMCIPRGHTSIHVDSHVCCYRSG